MACLSKQGGAKNPSPPSASTQTKASAEVWKGDAETTVSYGTDGHTQGTWTHPSGMKGDFQETWVIRRGGELCGIGDEGTKCGKLYRKRDLLVRIYDSGRVDRLIPMQSTATK